jgi:ketosteroid isomerase-like protein
MLMQRRVGLIRAILFCLFGAFALSAHSDSKKHPSFELAEQARVKRVIDQFFAAAQRQDWDAAGEVMSPEFEIYTDGADTFKKGAYVQLLKEDNLHVTYMELRDLEIRVSSDKRMAWAKYHGLFKSTNHGKRSSVETAETLIFTKEGVEWKIIRAHASIKNLETGQ